MVFGSIVGLIVKGKSLVLGARGLEIAKSNFSGRVANCRCLRGNRVGGHSTDFLRKLYTFRVNRSFGSKNVVGCVRA